MQHIISSDLPTNDDDDGDEEDGEEELMKTIALSTGFELLPRFLTVVNAKRFANQISQGGNTIGP